MCIHVFSTCIIKNLVSFPIEAVGSKSHRSASAGCCSLCLYFTELSGLLSLPSHPQSHSFLFPPFTNTPLRSLGLACCSGWAQLGSECLTRTYCSADTRPSRVFLCNTVDSCRLLPFNHQLSARGTSPAMKTRCVSGPMSVAAATDTLELAAKPVRDFVSQSVFD